MLEYSEFVWRCSIIRRTKASAQLKIRRVLELRTTMTRFRAVIGPPRRVVTSLRSGSILLRRSSNEFLLMLSWTYRRMVICIAWSWDLFAQADRLPLFLQHVYGMPHTQMKNQFSEQNGTSEQKNYIQNGSHPRCRFSPPLPAQELVNSQGQDVQILATA